MGQRLSKIYTRTGDKGTTGLGDGTLVSKDHPRIEAIGTVDELNSYIGLIRDQKISIETFNTLLSIQNSLFTLGAMLATPPSKELLKSGKERLQISKNDDTDIKFLENEIDQINQDLTPMKTFILPGVSRVFSFFHIAILIVRRAERITEKIKENMMPQQFIEDIGNAEGPLTIKPREVYGATASPIKMYPACAILEYANILVRFFCMIAAILPIVIVITARTPRANVQSRVRTTIPRTIILIAAANPTFFVPAARRAAIGGGAPSYVSGSHW